MDRAVDKCHTSEENPKICGITLRISENELTLHDRAGHGVSKPNGTGRSESQGDADWKRLESSSRPLAHSPECAEGLVSLPTNNDGTAPRSGKLEGKWRRDHAD